MQAIRIIREEHQSLAAVLHGLLYLVREIRAHRTEPDFELLGAMVYYIDTFPERFHHPKEDAWLFRLLLLRHPPAAEIIDRLQSEHRAGVGQAAATGAGADPVPAGRPRRVCRFSRRRSKPMSPSSATTCAARKPK